MMRTHLSDITAKLKVEFKGISHSVIKFFSFRSSAFLVLPLGHSEENKFKILECIRYLKIDVWYFGSSCKINFLGFC